LKADSKTYYLFSKSGSNATEIAAATCPCHRRARSFWCRRALLATQQQGSTRYPV